MGPRWDGSAVAWSVVAVASVLLAGCSSKAPPVVEEAPFVPVITTEAVDFSATMGPGQCINGPVVTACGGSVNVFGMESNPSYEQAADGRDLAGGELVLEWQASSPASDSLKVTALVMDCEDYCQANRTLTSDGGPSPLKLTLPARELGEDQSVVIVVEPVPLVQNYVVSVMQEVHLSGTIVFASKPPQPDVPEDSASCVTDAVNGTTECEDGVEPDDDEDSASGSSETNTTTDASARRALLVR